MVVINFEMLEIQDFDDVGKNRRRKMMKIHLVKSRKSCIWYQYLSTNMKWKFGNMEQISSKSIKDFFESLRLRNHEIWNQETKKPRNQETKNQETKNPFHTPTPTPAPDHPLGGHDSRFRRMARRIWGVLGAGQTHLRLIFLLRHKSLQHNSATWRQKDITMRLRIITTAGQHLLNNIIPTCMGTEKLKTGK